MHKIYIYNSWHNGDIITNRCLIKALLNYDLDIALASYENRHYLVNDLPVQHIVVSCDENAPHSPCLSSWRPEDRLSINSWCGTFKDIDERNHHNWSGIVETWNRHSEAYGLGITLSSREVPMIDFDYLCNVKTRGKAIFVESGHTRSPHSDFQFNMDKIGKMFPDFNFYCTSDVSCDLPNVISCGNLNLVDLSFISNSCEAIVGKGSGPFLCTYTESNRRKPRAVMNFNAPSFWEYRNNTLEYLHGEEALINFLQNVYDKTWNIL